MNRFEFKTVMSHLEKETLIQRMADNFAIPNDSMRDILMWLEGELHQYGKHLQGKVLDLTQELEDAKYEIETLRGQIVDQDIDLKDLQEKVNDLNDSLHNSETELDKLKSERKEIIESNALQAKENGNDLKTI